MSSPIAGASNTKIGTCPHGLPLGACPICSGMGGGGGGGGAHRKPKANEMSWDQCYAIGQMMKAQKLEQQQAKMNAAEQAQMLQMQKIAEQIASIRATIMNIIPQSVVKIFDGIKGLLLTPISQLGQKFVQAVQNTISNLAEFAQSVKDKLVNIADKLAAVFGEIKTAVEKKISEKFKDIKKKIFNLFGLSKVDDEEDEDVKKIEEQSRQEELKKAKDTIFNLKNPKELKNRSNEEE